MAADATTPTQAPLTPAQAEAAAVAAALHHLHLASTLPAAPQQRAGGWPREALLDGVDRGPRRPISWGDPHPWG